MLQKRNPKLAGALRDSVTLQRRAKDPNGDRLGAWEDVFATAARVLARTSGEAVLAQRIAGVQPVEVTMRLNAWSALVDTDWRLMWLGWPFEITAVAVDELTSVAVVLAVRTRDDNG